MPEKPPIYEPPAGWMRLINWFCAEHFLDEIEGDLYEWYNDKALKSGEIQAKRAFKWQAIRYLRPYFFGRKTISQALIQPDMIKNYLKTISRSFLKHKWYASLNLIGLTLAFVSIILIGIYLHHETNYENFHQKSDRIYRMTYFNKQGNSFKNHWARVPGDWINDLPEEVPEVTQLVRLQNKNRKYLEVGEEIFKPDYAFTTDQAIFEVFDFELLQGDRSNALVEPNSVILTQKLALKYFSTENVIGQTIDIRNDENSAAITYTITGILKDLPSNTHLPIDVLLSFSSPEQRSGWAYVYTLFGEGANPEAVFEKINTFVASKMNDNEVTQSGLEFQALPEIHLQSQLAREIKVNGNALYVKIFTWSALFILLIAFINFINLNSAISVGRAKEFGVRKIMGARKSHHLTYAFVEAISYSILALILAIGISLIVFPKLQQLTEMDRTVPLYAFGFLLLLLAIGGGLLAGIYPAFVINKIDLQRALKSSKIIHTSNGSINVKRLLVSVQFGAAILLIGSATAAYNQIRFIQQENLSLAQDQVLAIPSVPLSVTADYRNFREQVKNLSGVQQVAACMQVPSEEIRDSGPVTVSGVNSNPADAPLMDMQVIDADFIDLMDIKILAGQVPEQAFTAKATPEFGPGFDMITYLNEQERSYLINETAMRQLGWNQASEALGQEISWSIGPFSLANGKISGVIEDYHQETMKNKIDPLVLTLESIWLQTFLVKIKADQIPGTVQQISGIWQNTFPDYPMNYPFMDELFGQLYAAEHRQVRLLSIFSLLSILIAAIGLFSLIAFNLRTRLKELAIRQILGANLFVLARMIGREYFWPLLLSALIAIPLSYWAVQIWLANFAYQAPFSPLLYLGTLLIMLLVVALIIISQTFWSTKTSLVAYLKE
ncbi:MAG: ABC transporter permease [Saprospiraceae bacterium]